MATGGNARNTDVKRRFGERVRAYRTKLEISQEELADRAQLDRTYVSSVKCGYRNVALENICRLAAALQVDPGVLITGFPAPERRPDRPGGRPTEPP